MKFLKLLKTENYNFIVSSKGFTDEANLNLAIRKTGYSEVRKIVALFKVPVSPWPAITFYSCTAWIRNVGLKKFVFLHDFSVRDAHGLLLGSRASFFYMHSKSYPPPLPPP
jgi:hypothetical protein